MSIKRICQPYGAFVIGQSKLSHFNVKNETEREEYKGKV